jgi:CheY-like chemotaxis protein
MRVLVVEDEADLADAVARGLREWSMAVDVAADGEAALMNLGVHDYEVLVLDRDLPGISGDEVCRRVVAGAPRPRVLMLRLKPATSSTASRSAPTTTCASPSTSGSSSRASRRWPAVTAPPPRRSCSVGSSRSTRSGGRRGARVATWA